MSAGGAVVVVGTAGSGSVEAGDIGAGTFKGESGIGMSVGGRDSVVAITGGNAVGTASSSDGGTAVGTLGVGGVSMRSINWLI